MSVPVEYVVPRQWKRLYGLATDKRQSVTKANDLIPELAAQRITHDMAEAMLLAEFARRRWCGQVT